MMEKIAGAVAFRGDDILYLPRDRVVIQQAISPQQSVMLPSQVVEHFIEEAPYHFVMNRCICRDASHCQDYPVDLGCLFLGEPVLKIHPKMGHLVSKEEAHQHVQRARQAGLFHMVGRDRLDEIWLGATPGERLLTICNCCPCCCLWKMLPELGSGLSSKVARMPGVSLEVSEACVGCGRCVGECFVSAIHLNGGKAVIGEGCRGCGRCAEICPHQAIQLTAPSGQDIQAAIDHLNQAVHF